eukprot:scaffold182198_cov29-Tisochrysis_lutea.AAC.4
MEPCLSRVDDEVEAAWGGAHADSGGEVAQGVQVALHLPAANAAHPPAASALWHEGQEAERADGHAAVGREREADGRHRR